MNNRFPDMAPSCLRRVAIGPVHSRQGFTIIEVLVAVSIAAGVVSLLVPALTRQVTLGEEANRLTAVEAVVSSDLDWFNNYGRLWKLKAGGYRDPKNGGTITTEITRTNTYTWTGAATYEPPAADCNQSSDSPTGLAASLIADGQKLYAFSVAKKLSYKTFIPPYEIKLSPSTTTIQVSGGGVSGVNIIRKVEAVGNKIRLLYTLQGANADSLNFSREASVLVEAAAWCDRLP